MRTRRNSKKDFYRKKEDPHVINNRITAPIVRIVGEGIVSRECTREEALAIAEQKGVDLVLISDKAGGSAAPICRLIEYSKFKYEIRKKQKQNKKNTYKNVLKEIKLRLRIDQHDLAVKLRAAEKFLGKDYAKVKFSLHFMWKELTRKEEGVEMLQKIAQNFATLAKVEIPPKMEGKRKMTLQLTPLSKKSKAIKKK